MNEKLAKHYSETLKHVNEVRENLWRAIQELDHRAQIHDQSKFESPEAEIFANAPDLSGVGYGTDEYKNMLDSIRPAIDHHQSKNRHHPEFWKNGVDDMSLIDLIELLSDWKAATKRNKNGNIQKSIEYNTTRFNLSPQLVNILKNTVRDLYSD
jgi:hypothetical protein